MIDAPHDPARKRFTILAIARLAGALLIMAGLIVTNRAYTVVPPVAGYGMLALGLALFAFVPIMLARRWKSPPERSDQTRQ